eukprot:2472588-Heterocapsa_arctica.AAC.1
MDKIRFETYTDYTQVKTAVRARPLQREESAHHPPRQLRGRGQGRDPERRGLRRLYAAARRAGYVLQGVQRRPEHH